MEQNSPHSVVQDQIQRSRYLTSRPFSRRTAKVSLPQLSQVSLFPGKRHSAMSAPPTRSPENHRCPKHYSASASILIMPSSLTILIAHTRGLYRAFWRIPNLAYKFDRWLRMVTGEIDSRSAISQFDIPSPARYSTSNFLGVRIRSERWKLGTSP
jgi:hypothetical protein